MAYEKLNDLTKAIYRSGDFAQTNGEEPSFPLPPAFGSERSEWKISSRAAFGMALLLGLALWFFWPTIVSSQSNDLGYVVIASKEPEGNITKQKTHSAKQPDQGANQGGKVTENETVEEGTVIPKILVYVSGAVKNPGVYAIKPKGRIIDALKSAGGPKAEAELNAINLAAILEDGQQINFPTKEEVKTHDQHGPNGAESSISNSGSNSASSSLRGKGQGKTEGEKINLNEADEKTLTQLPGIGPAIAARIIKEREENGKYKNLEDLARVKGIGSSLINDLKDRVKW
ncbi:hypothetical protein BK816_06185 [Boudabousia tangfeifanii]|uniref:Helix-hairpin-helix DNA-binding motif class 1 domain-containing protein n=2 Tax=Boudabousia tangfeifanii TaxID=1912795 RepID=A0A1D9ML95_9ACTO|nr:hypothetical protein BK816_06185 [Boudabousia tangfeifanii]